MTIDPQTLDSIINDPSSSPEGQPQVLRYLTPDQVKQLNADEENWREHPTSQADFLVNVMNDLESRTDDGVQGRGWHGSLEYNVRGNKFRDGHLRQEVIDRLPTTANGRIPVMFGSWNEDQHRIALITGDPIAGMATANQTVLEAVIRTAQDLDNMDDQVVALLTHVAHDHGIVLDTTWQGKEAIDPASIPDYNPAKEVVQIRINGVRVGDSEVVVYLLNMALDGMFGDGVYKAEEF